MSRVGEKISNIRRGKGLTPKQLAKMMGVSEKFVIDIESGKKIVSDDLIRKAAKILGEEINELNVISPESDLPREDKKSQDTSKVSPVKIQEVWSDALESVLKAVPVYDYSLCRIIHTKNMPVVSNKIEGYAKDKVFYLEIQDNDMIGFRIMKGDLAFCYMTGELQNNAFYLVEYSGNKVVRQIKKLDSQKVLMIGNNGKMTTDTAQLGSIKILARLVTLEVKL